MKYVRTYESFKKRENNSSLNQYQDDEVVNEEVIGMLGNLLKTATGAFKNFINGLMAPFKKLKDEIKKNPDLDEVTKDFTLAMDEILKTTTNNIVKAKDEAELTQMWDTFTKQIDDKMSEFDKEVKSEKPGDLQDAFIRARVFFGMLKTELVNKKIANDQKFASAKDLNAKKASRKEYITSAISGFKKKLNDPKLISEATKKYKEENKIESTGGGKIILGWGEIEMELKRIKTSAQGGRGIYNYQVVKSNSKKLKVEDKDEVLVIINGLAKKGERIKLEEIYRDGKEDPLREYETGSIEEIIVVDDKGVESKPNEIEMGKSDGIDEDDKEFTNTLGELKKKDPESIKKLKKISNLYKDKDNPKNKQTIQNIQKELQAKEGQAGK